MSEEQRGGERAAMGVEPVRVGRAERVPEEEFDERDMAEDWHVIARKDGYVYIGHKGVEV